VVLREVTALPSGHESMRHVASLGAAIGQSRSSGKVDAAALCEALCEAEQERHGRFGGNLRSSDVSDHAVRGDQNTVTAVRVNAGPDPAVVRPPTNHTD